MGVEVANHLSDSCAHGVRTDFLLFLSWESIADLDVSCSQSCHSTAEPVKHSLPVHLEAWLPFIQAVLGHKKYTKELKKAALYISAAFLDFSQKNIH